MKSITKSELKRNAEDTGSYFFTRETMRFFGDSMVNYGLHMDKLNNVYCLTRKRPVKHGLNDTAYFNADTFERVYHAILKCRNGIYYRKRRKTNT